MLREIEIKTDFCVIGGGMAGLCAAIAAARHGTKVVLIHERPVLGGNASSEMRMWICGAQGRDNRETGILEEIMLENLYRNPTKNHYIFDSILLDFVKNEPNITLLLNAACIGADSEKGVFPHGRTVKINSVRAYQMTTQRFYTVKAGIFADCSGDSILAPLTGVSYMYGRESAGEYGEDTVREEPDSLVMGSSCLIQGRETGENVAFTPSDNLVPLSEEEAANRPMNIHSTGENFWYLELGGDTDTIDRAEETKDELIPLALAAWDRLKNRPEYNAGNWDLNFLGFLPAKRESRRYKGEYVLTQKDISSDRVFPDTVAFGGWPLDDHDPAGYRHRGAPNSAIPTPAPYCIPYRSLYSADAVNLLFAGRNISVTHLALSSTRVMGTCSVIGQAAGTAASIAIKGGLTPHEVYLYRIEELRQTLADDDCFIPYFVRNQSPAATLEGDYSALCDGIDRPNKIYGTASCGLEIENGVRVEYELPPETEGLEVHVVFDSDLCRDTLPGDAMERSHITRANVPLNAPQMRMPLTLCREFTLTAVKKDGQTETLARVENNRKRSYHFKLSGRYQNVSLCVISNWGGTEKTRVFSYDVKKS